MREELTNKRTYTIYPPFRWIAGGIKICAVSNFINTGKKFGGGGGGDLVFFNMKRDQREKRYFYKICRFFLNF